MTFELIACRLALLARNVIRFPPGMAGNVLRGALGKALREAATAEDYARIFHPRASGEASGGGSITPSGLADRPRLFVFRCALLNGRAFQPGEQFCFGLNLFDCCDATLHLIGSAFAQWADIVSVEQSRVAIDLAPPSEPVSRIRVEFHTPTELKTERGRDPADFAVLLARARDRISTLRSLYGGGPLEIDFRGLADRARSVRTARSELRRLPVQRRSGRTGQHHGIGGYVGFAEYEGALAEFMPYLETASWTGVGRYCSWGNGQIETRILDSDS